MNRIILIIFGLNVVYFNIMKRIVLLFQLLTLFFVFLSCDSSNSKNESEIPLETEVKIGKQVWMIKNLDVDTFRNGDAIPEAKTDEEWVRAGEESKPAWCYYENDPKNGKKYGKLYNWYAVVDPRGLAPKGWHIPSDAEWSSLINYLGGNEIAGKKMKSKHGWKGNIPVGYKVCPNCSSWNAEYRSKVPCHVCKDKRFVKALKNVKSGNGTFESGFMGLPGGWRSNDGWYFSDVGVNGYWWSSSEYNKYYAWFRYLNYNNRTAYRNYNYSKSFGFSVRCLRD